MPIYVGSLDFLPQTILAGGQYALAARYYSQLSVETDAACTATVIRVDVDPMDSSRVPPGTFPPIPGAPVVSGVNQYSVLPSTLTTISVDWPFYLVQAAGGTCRVALV